MQGATGMHKTGVLTLARPQVTKHGARCCAKESLCPFLQVKLGTADAAAWTSAEVAGGACWFPKSHNCQSSNIILLLLHNVTLSRAPPVIRFHLMIHDSPGKPSLLARKPCPEI